MLYIGIGYILEAMLDLISLYINRVSQGNDRLRNDLFKAKRRSNGGVATKSDTTIAKSGKACKKWVIEDAIRYHDLLIRKYSEETQCKIDDSLESKSMRLARIPILKVSRKNGLRYSDTYKIKHL